MTNLQPRRTWSTRLGDLCTRHKVRTAVIVAGGVLGLATMSSAFKSSDAVDASARSAVTTVVVPAPTTVPGTTGVTPPTTARTTVPATTAPTTVPPPTVVLVPAAPTTAPAPVPPTTLPPTPAAPAVTVTKVVDGDTLDVSTGARIRLIGIDAPEVGSCGADAATVRLRALTLGKAVTLVPGARDDIDRYGRLLRYVDVAGADAGRTLLAEGLARPRYNSTDGYGRHVREADYQIAWNSAAWTSSPCRVAAPPATVPPSKPAPAPAPKPVSTTAPRPPSNFVHPGAFCAPAGMTGVTSTGKAMVCTTTATDSRNRWRAA